MADAPPVLTAGARGGDAALIDLSRRARQARSLAELRFLLVNDSLHLAAYRQCALWQAGRGVTALSGLVQPEANAPYAQWLQRLALHLSAQPNGDTPRAFSSLDLPPDLARDWQEWWPAQALWVPMPGAAWLLAREGAWREAEIALLAEWAGAWSHALLALQARPSTGFAWPWQRDTAGLLPSRPWWKRRALWGLAALAVAGAVPVPLTVLAPGELVPARPTVVRSPLDGIVDVFHVRPNQLVKKGDPLFGFDEALIQSRLEVAQQALATAGTEHRQAVQQALVDVRVRPQLAALTGRIQERRAEVAFLREQLTRARVLAPQDGMVLFDDPSEWIGKPLAVGERVLRIAAPGDVEVEAWLPLADAIPLADGAALSLFLNAAPTEPLQARLRYIGHEAVARPDGSYAYRVRATLEAPTDQRVGLKGTARLHGDTVPAAYWVMRRPLAWLRSTVGL